jgi:hypothetical protein
MFKAAATTVSALLSLITFERVRHIDTLWLQGDSPINEQIVSIYYAHIHVYIRLKWKCQFFRHENSITWLIPESMKQFSHQRCVSSHKQVDQMLYGKIAQIEARTMLYISDFTSYLFKWNKSRHLPCGWAKLARGSKWVSVCVCVCERERERESALW